MKKPNRHHWTIGLLSINAAIVFLAAGCSTPPPAEPAKYYYNGEIVSGPRSYNSDYHDNLVTQPNYWIHSETDTHFMVTVEQGVPSWGAENVIDAKVAANVVAKAEALRLGWTKWHVDYIPQTGKGWQHTVGAIVTRDS
jgi:hypothetical protein